MTTPLKKKKLCLTIRDTDWCASTFHHILYQFKAICGGYANIFGSKLCSDYIKIVFSVAKGTSVDASEVEAGEELVGRVPQMPPSSS